MSAPRYYTRYQCRKDGPHVAATHFAFVRDSWYCHWDVARFEQTGGGDGRGNIGAMVLSKAEKLAAEWHAEHEACLA